jgi:lipopolysaccharide export LptBFGC system permease protein LptF
MMKNKVPIKKTLSNEKGVMLTEFALIIPLFVIAVLFMIFVYDFTEEIHTVTENVRYEMRDSINRNSHGRFREVTIEQTARSTPVAVIRKILGKSSYETDISLTSYEGCYRHLYKNEYRRGYLYREIM